MDESCCMYLNLRQATDSLQDCQEMMTDYIPSTSVLVESFLSICNDHKYQKKMFLCDGQSFFFEKNPGEQMIPEELTDIRVNGSPKRS